MWDCLNCWAIIEYVIIHADSSVFVIAVFNCSLFAGYAIASNFTAALTIPH